MPQQHDKNVIHVGSERLCNTTRTFNTTGTWSMLSRMKNRKPFLELREYPVSRQRLRIHARPKHRRTNRTKIETDLKP